MTDDGGGFPHLSCGMCADAPPRLTESTNQRADEGPTLGLKKLMQEDSMATFNVIETNENKGELISTFLCGDKASDKTREMFGINNDGIFGTVLVAINKQEEGSVTDLINIDINVIEEIVKLTKSTYWMKAILEDNGFVKAPQELIELRKS